MLIDRNALVTLLQGYRDGISMAKCLTTAECWARRDEVDAVIDIVRQMEPAESGSKIDAPAVNAPVVDMPVAPDTDAPDADEAEVVPQKKRRARKPKAVNGE